MRALTDCIFDCIRTRFPTTKAVLRAYDVQLPGLGAVFGDDVGDGRGRLYAQPETSGNQTREQLELDFPLA